LDNYTDMFTVTSMGDIILRNHLDYETQDNYIFQVYATDGLMVSRLFLIKDPQIRLQKKVALI
jgi:hypothetical protein